MEIWRKVVVIMVMLHCTVELFQAYLQTAIFDHGDGHIRKGLVIPMLI